MCSRNVTADARNVNANILMDGSTLNNLENLYYYMLGTPDKKYGIFQELHSVTRKT